MSFSYPNTMLLSFNVFTTTHALCTVHYALCTMHYTLHTINYALCTMHYALYTIHYTPYTTHYKLCTTENEVVRQNTSTKALKLRESRLLVLRGEDEEKTMDR
jgi:hypothetical protein